MSKERSLKKHIAAVHISGKMTLLQRKIANVLLFYAYKDLLTADSHCMRIRDLAELVGFDSNDLNLVKTAFRTLASTPIEWNLLEDGRETWEVTSMLSRAKIIPSRGLCEYAYDSSLREKLYNPEMYARINLSIQQQFSSGYSLVLYENCSRYRGVGSTGWIDLETWRKLFGIKEGQYKQFKDFSRRVLKPAIQEVNHSSDLMINVEYRKEKRRIVGIRFLIRENPQVPIAFPVAPKDSPLLKKMLDFGVSGTAAKKLIGTFDSERIESNLEYVQTQLDSGKEIRNIGAFTAKAISEDYRPEKSLFEQKQEQQTLEREAQVLAQKQGKLLAELKKAGSMEIRRAFIAELSQEKYDDLLASFKKELGDSLLASTVKTLDSPLIAEMLKQHIPDYEKREAEYLSHHQRSADAA